MKIRSIQSKKFKSSRSLVLGTNTRKLQNHGHKKLAERGSRWGDEYRAPGTLDSINTETITLAWCFKS